MTSSYALSWKPFQGDSLNLPDHSVIKMEMVILIPVESYSVQCHGQTTKGHDHKPYKIQGIMKVKELVTNFQDDATVSCMLVKTQGSKCQPKSIKTKDKEFKDSDRKENVKDNDKGSESKISELLEGTSLQLVGQSQRSTRAQRQKKSIIKSHEIVWKNPNLRHIESKKPIPEVNPVMPEPNHIEPERRILRKHLKEESEHNIGYGDQFCPTLTDPSARGKLQLRMKLKDKEMQLVIARMDCVSAEWRLHESIGWNQERFIGR
ncbi:hypothetical protein Tco_0178611 [Tanacetum coccineum]